MKAMPGGEEARLATAVARGIITAAQAEAIRALDLPGGAEGATGGPAEREPSRESARGFNAATIAYVVGAVTVVGAMGWFLADRWEWLGPWGVLLTTAVYAVLFLFVARRLGHEGFATASGFAVVLAVAMVPPGVTALNDLIGWFPGGWGRSCRWPDFVFWSCRGHELVVELATALAALVALRRTRFSLLVLPLAAIAVRLLFHLTDGWGLHVIGDASGGWIWVAGGSGLAAIAYATDRRQRGDEDFARWLHLAAAACAVPASLHLLSAYEPFRHFLVPGAFVAFAAALLLRRWVWLLLGMGWFVAYLGWLAGEVFRDSPAFPILLAAIGIGVIIATVWVQRNAATLVARFGTVTSDGRPRFPGGVPLLLAPAAVALLLLPGAFEDDAERRRHWDWQYRRSVRQMARETKKAKAAAQARADSVAAARGAVPAARAPQPSPGRGETPPRARP